jgi:antitoxin component YwqK of YwqJK toxin-antitoxin module
VIFIFTVHISVAQTNVTFYDYKWNKCEAAAARFYSTVEKTDSGWLRFDYFVSTNKPQMVALYKDSGCKIINGNVDYYYANGYLQAEGRKTNDKKEGIYLRWHPNGMMADSGNYINDNFIGTKLSWHSNGVLSDSLTRINDSTVVSVSWFDNGNPDCYGYTIKGKKSGKWNYFHKNGKTAAIEMNENGKQTIVEYFNDDGSPLTDTTQNKREASFKGSVKKWQDYLMNKTYWPPTYTLTNTDKVTVVVNFTINEEGKVEDAFVSVPFHALFDNIALDVIKKSPDWLPRKDHNRSVKQYLSQPQTFFQQ